LVINNPGTTCAEEYAAHPVADVVCLVENGKDFSVFHLPTWANGYKADRFAGTIHGIADPAKMKRYVLNMIDKRVGYGYITDGTGVNPWCRLPLYWDAEVDAVQQVNAK
jgi:hypothetical protein